MVKIFISYRRDDSRAFAGRIYDQLSDKFGDKNIFMDVDDMPAGKDFRGILRETVANTDIMLVLIGDKWLSITDNKGNRRLDNPSDFVRLEVQTGLERDDCLVIPVLIDGARMPTPDELPIELRELAFRNAMLIRNDPDFRRDIERLINAVATGRKPHTRGKSCRDILMDGQIIAAIIGAFAVVVAALIGLYGMSNRDNNIPDTQTTTAMAITEDVTQEVLPTETPSQTPTSTETLSAAEVEETIRAEMVTIQAEQRQTQAAIETTVAEAETLATAATANALTQIAESWTDTSTPNLRATAETRSTQDAQATINAQATVDTQQTLFAPTLEMYRTQTEVAHATNIRATVDTIGTDAAQARQFSTTTARIEATQRVRDVTATEQAHATDIRATVDTIKTQNAQPAEITLALNGVNTNDEWTPYIQIFNSVEMVLVPKGCFMMGSTDEQIDYALSIGALRDYLTDVQPVNQYCFDTPFWIDYHEVSNAQFDQFDGVAANNSTWTVDNLPREQITWFEAKAYCEHRAARLPTEAEWEYAARGPDSLIYPWGNEVDRNLLNVESTDGEDTYENTAPVDAFADGVSWVGAYQMSGNVWEWVNTIYFDFPYPYATDDGREEYSNSDRIRHILRGGSWRFPSFSSLPTFRHFDYPNTASNEIGFRCARDY